MNNMEEKDMLLLGVHISYMNVDNFDEKDLAYIFNKLDVQNKRECLKAYFLSIIDNLANENDKEKYDDNS